MTIERDYGHIEQFLGEGWDEDADLSGTLFGCIPRGKLEKFHIHVYRVAWMAELNVSAVDDLVKVGELNRSAALLTRGQVPGLLHRSVCLLVRLGYFSKVNFLPHYFFYPYIIG